MKNRKIGELYDEYRKYLLTIIANSLYDGCPRDAMYDCLNDVFIIALDKKNDKKFNANPKAWLVQTTRFVVENYNRKMVNRQKFHTDVENMDEIICEKDMLEDLVFKTAIEEKLLLRIKKNLTPEERVFYIMRFEQMKSIPQIAEELYMRPNTASKRISRLKKRITKMIKEFTSD